MRAWPGLAAVGAGLIHLGIGAGSSPVLLAAFVLVGAAETGWGVAALARSDLPLLRGGFGAAVLLVAAWVAVLLAGGAHQHAATPATQASGPPIGAMSGAGALDLAVAAMLAVRLRRGSAPASDDTRVVRSLIGTAIGAGVVAVVATTSLAGTAVGAHHVH